MLPTETILTPVNHTHTHTIIMTKIFHIAWNMFVWEGSLGVYCASHRTVPYQITTWYVYSDFMVFGYCMSGILYDL